MKADLVLGGLVVGSLLAAILWPRSAPPQPHPQQTALEQDLPEAPGDEGSSGRLVTLRVEGPVQAILRDAAGEERGRTEGDGRITLRLGPDQDEVLRVEAEGYLTTEVRAGTLLAGETQGEFVVVLAPHPGAPLPPSPTGPGDLQVVAVGPDGPPQDCLFEVLRAGVRVRAGRLDANGRTRLPRSAWEGSSQEAEGAGTWLLLRPRDLAPCILSLGGQEGGELRVVLDAGGSFTFHLRGIRRQPAVFHNLEVVDRASGLLLQVLQPTIDERYRGRQLPLGRALVLRRPGREEFVQVIAEDLVLSPEQPAVDLGVIDLEDGGEERP